MKVENSLTSRDWNLCIVCASNMNKSMHKQGASCIVASSRWPPCALKMRKFLFVVFTHGISHAKWCNKFIERSIVIQGWKCLPCTHQVLILQYSSNIVLLWRSRRKELIDLKHSHNRKWLSVLLPLFSKTLMPHVLSTCSAISHSSKLHCIFFPSSHKNLWQ